MPLQKWRTIKVPVNSASNPCALDASRIARQKEIDASIAAKAEFEFLYDKPYTDPKTVRVAGPFTVESLSPRRTLGVDEHDELIDEVREGSPDYPANRSFPPSSATPTSSAKTIPTAH